MRKGFSDSDRHKNNGANKGRGGRSGDGSRSGQPHKKHAPHKGAAKAGGHSSMHRREPLVEVKGRQDRYWLYGWHAVVAALNNPARKFFRCYATESALQEMSAKPALLAKAQAIGLEKASGQEISAILANDAPHQGLALEVAHLAAPGLEAVLESPRSGPVVMLDQVTDPQNVGAILRSALAFGARGVVMTERHSAAETGALAKAAAGALETMPLVRVPNLVNAMLALKSNGYWVVGLDGQASSALHELNLHHKTVLVLGSEGEGLRRLTAERCDHLAKLPISDEMESLNVSAAAAVALYELVRV